jgi:hypothetical protein
MFQSSGAHLPKKSAPLGKEGGNSEVDDKNEFIVQCLLFLSLFNSFFKLFAQTVLRIYM